MSEGAVSHRQAAGGNAYVNPSVGRIGVIYFDDRNNRIKFFSPEVHTERAGIERLLGECLERMRQHNATRVNARFLVQGEFQHPALEAAIPLNNGFTGVSLVYLGINHHTRGDSARVEDGEDKIVQSVCAMQRHMRLSQPEGYCIGRVHADALLPNDLDDMARLYHEAFPTYTSALDRDALLAMVSNSVVYVARDSDKKIVSASAAEIAEFGTGRGEFRVCEISETATLREHRGKGLATAVSQAMIAHIRGRVDLLYAEARACHTAINRCFFNLGFHYAGRLAKQCVLSGDHEIAESGPYENLNVWHMLPKEG